MRSTPECRPPLVTALLLAVLAVAASPAAAQTTQAAGAAPATTGRGAPDPCAIVTVADAGAIAGVPMQRRASAAEADIEAARTCTYYGKAPTGGGALLLRVVTYRCLGGEPKALVRHLEQSKWGSARFQHEPDLGPLTTSLVTAAGAQVMGFKGPTGLTVYLGGRSPTSSRSHATATRPRSRGSREPPVERPAAGAARAAAGERGARAGGGTAARAGARAVSPWLRSAAPC